MQNSSRIRTQSQIKQFLSDQKIYYKIDNLIDFISPWNIHDHKNNQSSPYTFQNKHHTSPNIIDSQQIQNSSFKKTKNIRLRTQGSKAIKQKHIINFNPKVPFLNNFFSTIHPSQQNRFLNTRLKKTRKLPSRKNYKTPVVNINQHTFQQKAYTEPMKTFHQVITSKQKRNNRTVNISSIHASLQKDIDLSNAYIKRRKSFNLKKFSTQKNMLFQKSVQNFQKKLNLQILNYKTGHGTIMQNLKKLTMNQSRIRIKQIKSKSLSKFNKTFY